MAVYRLEVRPLRGNVSQKIAYRSRTGSYEKRHEDVLYSEILLPSIYENLLIPSRETIWSYLEATERLKNGLLAKEVLVSLPKELNREDQVLLCRELSIELCNRYKILADLNIHRAPEEATGNVHAHIVLSNRCVDCEKREMVFLDCKPRLLRTRGEIFWLRKHWEEQVNRMLKARGIEKEVSCLQLRARGIDRSARPRLSRYHIEEEKRTGKPSLRRQKFCEEVYKLVLEGKVEGETAEAILDSLEIRESLTRLYLEKRLEGVLDERSKHVQSNHTNSERGRVASSSSSKVGLEMER